MSAIRTVTIPVPVTEGGTEATDAAQARANLGAAASGENTDITRLSLTPGTTDNPALKFSNSGDSGLYSGAAGFIGIVSGSTERVTVSPSGLIINGSGSTILLQAGSATTPAINFGNISGDSNTGIYRVAADQLGISTGGTLRGTWSSSGLAMGSNLGISFAGTGAATTRTNLGATTLGGNLFTLTNPSAVSFPRFNADNTATARTASEMRGDLGAAASGANSDITSLTALSTPLSVPQGGTGVTSLPKFRGYLASNTTLTLSGVTTFVLASVYDTASGFSGGNYTVPVSGKYRMAVNYWRFTGGSAGMSIWLGFYRNGSLQDIFETVESTTATTPFYIDGSTEVELSAGDVLSIRAFQSGGAVAWAIDNGGNGNNNRVTISFMP